MLSTILFFSMFITLCSSISFHINSLYEEVNLFTCIKHPSIYTCNLFLEKLTIKNYIVKMCVNLLYNMNFFPDQIYKSDIVKICPYAIRGNTYYEKDIVNILSNSTKLEYYIYLYLPDIKDNFMDINERFKTFI